MSTTPCRVTPPLGARAPAHDGEYYTPTLRLARAQTSIGPSQSPSRSLETARPIGRASALGGGFGTPKRTPYPLVRRAGRDRPFPVSVGLLGGKGTSLVGWELVGWDTGDLPSQRERERSFIDNQEVTEGRRVQRPVG